MDFSAFSHGQIQSKLWLCSILEPYISYNSNVVILGCWYNIVSFLLLSRKPNYYRKILGIDKNQNNIDISQKICNAWMINNDQIIQNICCNVDEVDFSNIDVVINTSIEDMEETNWFLKIPKDTLVCFQTLNLSKAQTAKYENWEIKNENNTMEIFLQKFPLQQTFFTGKKEFDYGDLKYHRYMLIGKK